MTPGSTGRKRLPRAERERQARDAALLVEALGVPEPPLADAGPVGEADREARLARLRNPAPQPA